MYMKKLIFILAIINLSQLKVQSQETRLITKDNYEFYEEYSVLKSDKKVKHGSYIKLNKVMFIGNAIESIGSYWNGQKNGLWEIYYKNDNNIKQKGFYKNDIKDSTWTYFFQEDSSKQLQFVQTEEGQSLQIVNANPKVSRTGNYKNGEPVGIWEFYDHAGQLLHRYNYDSDSLLFAENSDINNIEAGCLGGETSLYQELYEIFDLGGLMSKVNSKINIQSSKIVFKFTVDVNGEIADIAEVENTVGNKKIYARALETTQFLKNKMYPKRINGQSLPSAKTISFSLKVELKSINSIMSHNISQDFYIEISIN